MIDWQNTTMLVTGGAGSFGRRFIEIVLRELRPKKLIIFSRDEWKQHEMRTNGFDHSSLRYFIGDVRDLERLRRATEGVDVIVHAAALKQVPACEYNPMEAVETNINGTRNVVDAALDNGVKRVMMLSTDKATAPLNIYGASKLVAEKLCVHANAYRGQRPTRFACVRYGNVLGSRGSVLPLFEEQRERGRITITDPEMTRFWMTLDQSVRFVLSRLDVMCGGEVFVPKLPSMKLFDLARTVAPEATIDVIGPRVGEKLHEEMLSVEEARQAIEVEDGFVLLGNEDPNTQGYWRVRGQTPPPGFAYNSASNPVWITGEALLQMLESGGQAETYAGASSQFVAV